MTKLYRSLLRLYPAAHRREFGDEMLDVFCEADGDAAERGILPHLVFLAHEVAGLLRGAIDEQLNNLTGSLWRVSASRRLTMGSRFRYPKTTIVLMALSLAGAVLAILRAGAIANSTHPGLGATLYSIPRGALVVFVASWTIGVIVWLVLFALRRSGMHRLADVQTWPQK